MKTKALIIIAATAVVVVALYLGLYSQSNTPKKDLALQNNKTERAENKITISQYNYILDDSIPWKKRVGMIREIRPENLSKEDKDFLYSTLDRSVEYNREEWFVVLNEVMGTLSNVESDTQQYVNSLLSLLNNTSVDEVVRDYAVQYLGTYCIPKSELVNEATHVSQAQLEQVLSEFTKLVSDPELSKTSIPGTTLNVIIAMKQGGSTPEPISKAIAEISPWIEQAVNGEITLPLHTRVTAINAAGDLNLVATTETIRSFAQSEEVDASIRLNSIAALGNLGSSLDRDSLESLANSDSKFRFAAQSALKNLNKKL